MAEMTVKVLGMTCDHCKRAVEQALQALPGVSKAQANVAAGLATIEFTKQLSEEAVKVAIEDAGYDWGGKA
ncbi:heavy-metal-associated domain-containing protein [Sulfoacidibacillus thermotolerans]|uniref:HMA domain-containing protein n=1 Tax=Sulfoacidibacillus thermotolerans TaxID=1765684 RepID=A0A2U3D6H4_SULT2|nr:cation transporter [Sulfoacidibacillus thermotolerans]PWI56875.1 hypothetical protein BM613_11615 [Sulfoacidibacillus thermotolerans]